jgi:hypothetical protein
MGLFPFFDLPKMTDTFNTNTHEVTLPKDDRLSTAYVNSDIFRTYLASHDLANDPLLTPEQWAIVKSFDQKYYLKKIHSISIGTEGRAFSARAKEIDPNAELTAPGYIENPDTDILGYTELSGRPDALAEKDAQAIFAKRERLRNSFGYKKTMKPALG